VAYYTTRLFGLLLRNLRSIFYRKALINGNYTAITAKEEGIPGKRLVTFIEGSRETRQLCGCSSRTNTFKIISASKLMIYLQ
jgi:hypothetical protein